MFLEAKLAIEDCVIFLDILRQMKYPLYGFFEFCVSKEKDWGERMASITRFKRRLKKCFESFDSLIFAFGSKENILRGLRLKGGFVG